MRKLRHPEEGIANLTGEGVVLVFSGIKGGSIGVSDETGDVALLHFQLSIWPEYESVWDWSQSIQANLT